jgi:hypothetical protein
MDLHSENNQLRVNLEVVVYRLMEAWNINLPPHPFIEIANVVEIVDEVAPALDETELWQEIRARLVVQEGERVAREAELDAQLAGLHLGLQQPGHGWILRK